MECLDDQTVLDFIEGKLGPDAIASVDSHLDGCAACRELLMGMHGADPLPEAAPIPEPGHRFSRFALLERLGAGAMGVVYAAYDPQLDRRVALKVLTTEHDDPSTRARLLVEAQAMARLSHPNVVTIFDVGSTEQTVFIAMELVDGPTLRAWTAATPRSWREVRNVCVEAGRGLMAAHAAGLVHRDYKPDNVIVGTDRTRVGDFGLATAAAMPTAPAAPVVSVELASLEQPLTATGRVVGTPAYMSPEQLRGERPTAASDQFSFCVATFEALFGARPFVATNVAELTTAVEAGRIATPTAGIAPSWVLDALRRGLSPEPSDRFPSMERLLDALQRDRRARTGAKIAGVASLVVATSAGAYWMGVSTPPPSESRCDGAATEIAEIWDPARAQALVETLATVQPDYGGALGTSVVASVDTWTGGWVEHHTQACQATVQRTQTDAQLDARMACLSGHKRDLAALVDQWFASPTSSLELMPQAVAQLPDVGACADVVTLAMPVPPPGDPRLARTVERVRDQASGVRALLRTGQVQLGGTEAVALLEAARATAYAPVIAEAWLVVAAAARMRGALPDATEAAYEALWAAQTSRHDRVVARAWTSLLTISSAAGHYERAPRLGRHALAALERVGMPASLEAPLRNTLGIAYDNLGQPQQARRSLERALTLRRQQFGDHGTETARVLTNLGNLARGERRHADALKLHRQALAVDRAALGAEHPIVGRDLHNVARVLLLTGERDDALDHYQHALTIKRSAHGERHVEVARTLNSLGLLHAADGSSTQATEHFERALEIYDALGHPERALVHYNLGLGLAAAHEPHAALAQYDAALPIVEEHWGARSRRHVEVLLARADTLRTLKLPSARASYARALGAATELRDDVLRQRARDGLDALPEDGSFQPEPQTGADTRSRPPATVESPASSDNPSAAAVEAPASSGNPSAAAVDSDPSTPPPTKPPAPPTPPSDDAPKPPPAGAYAAGPGLDDP